MALWGWLALGSTLLDAAGKAREGKANAESLKSSAMAKERNAQVLDNNAARTRKETSVNIDLARDDMQRALGKQRAAIGQAGVGQGGSTRLVLEDAALSQAMNILGIQYQGETQARQYEDDAKLERWGAGSDRSNAKEAKTAGYLNALGSVISGGSDFYTKLKSTK